MSDQNEIGLDTEAYSEQILRWPETGRHILAQYDDDTIIVYQAYRFVAKDGCILIFCASGYSDRDAWHVSSKVL